ASAARSGAPSRAPSSPRSPSLRPRGSYGLAVVLGISLGADQCRLGGGGLLHGRRARRRLSRRRARWRLACGRGRDGRRRRWVCRVLGRALVLLMCIVAFSARLAYPLAIC